MKFTNTWNYLVDFRLTEGDDSTGDVCDLVMDVDLTVAFGSIRSRETGSESLWVDLVLVPELFRLDLWWTLWLSVLSETSASSPPSSFPSPSVGDLKEWKNWIRAFILCQSARYVIRQKRDNEYPMSCVVSCWNSSVGILLEFLDVKKTKGCSSLSKDSQER